MAPFVAALPWIMAATAATSAGLSIYQATRGAPKLPKAPDLTTPVESEKAMDAAYSQMESLRKRRGYASTILTSPLGATDQPVTYKSQLGA